MLLLLLPLLLLFQVELPVHFQLDAAALDSCTGGLAGPSHQER
jgi:hypothetical protein